MLTQASVLDKEMKMEESRDRLNGSASNELLRKVLGVEHCKRSNAE